MTRHRWEVRDAATNEILSPPYYAGAAAIRVARTYWEHYQRAVIVTRDGREWQRFPSPAA